MLRFFGVFSLFLAGCDAVIDELGAPFDPDATAQMTFTVPKGASAHGLVDPLSEQGLVDADMYPLYLKLSKEGGCIKAGDHKVRASMTTHELLESLCGTPIPHEIEITI